MNQSDATADNIIQQIISEQKDKTNVIRKPILETIAIEAKRFKSEALRRLALNTYDQSQIRQAIQTIYNLDAYQTSPAQYVYSHLE